MDYRTFVVSALVVSSSLLGFAKADQEGCRSVADVNAAAAGFVTLLLASSGNADLAARLNAETEVEDPITIFVPSNDAINDAEGDVNLEEVLRRHVVEGRYLTNTTAAGDTATALSGDTLEFSEFLSSVTVVGADMEAPANLAQPFDQITCGGVIHFIDMVLPSGSGETMSPEESPDAEMMAPMDAPEMSPEEMDADDDSDAPGAAPSMPGTRNLPPGTRSLPGEDDMTDDDAMMVGDMPAMGPSMTPEGAAGPGGVCSNIVEALLGNDDTEALAYLATILLSEDEVALLSDPTTAATVFSPPKDDLLRLYTAVAAEDVTAEQAAAILTSHIVTEYLPSPEVIALDGESAEALSEEEIEVSVDGEAVSVTVGDTTAVVTEVDIDACSDVQVIHAIDSVLLPEGATIDLEQYDPASVTDLAAAAQMTDAASPGAAPAGDRGIGNETDSASGVKVLGAAVVAVLAVLVL